MRGPRRSWTAALLATLALDAGAQVATPPKPIPAPPIPAPPQLGPPPPVRFGAPVHPPRPDISVPEAPTLSPVTIPPPPRMTAADPTDPTKPPVSGATTGPTAMVSPGATPAQIDEITFDLAPGVADIPTAGAVQLTAAAKSLAQDPAARLEVRVFSPTKKADSQSNARRLSLARYLAIRAYLIKAGVADHRIDGRPLASIPDELNPDRVELYIER